MKQDYTNVISQLSLMLFQALQESQPDLELILAELERLIAAILRQVGLQVVTMVFNQLSSTLTQKAKAEGLVVHRKIRVKYAVLFGRLEIESPYLWDKKNRRSARPLKEQLGISHGGRSPALQRALTDFGAEESFGQAAKRFEEHYGWDIGRATMRREVEQVAQLAERYVDIRLLEAFLNYSQPPASLPEDERVLVELDGCHIRTAQKVVVTGSEVTKKRRLPLSRRPCDWREVRVGFARPVQNQEQRTFVARMSKYPDIVQQLVSAACDQGMKPNTPIFALADGGNGLREALLARFPNLTFILDRPHVKQHLYATAQAMELTDTQRHSWVRQQIHLLDCGHVQQVITTLGDYQGAGSDRVENLRQYLERFSDAVHYDHFRAIGLPIGSGEIESAHRYIPQKRLKIPGACWHPNTINPMLALRIIRANNWWQDFWHFVTTSPLFQNQVSVPVAVCG